MEQILFRAMGCEIFCGIDSRHPCSRERLERAPAMFEAWEQTLSRFRADSELAQLNARAGETVCVSDSLWRVLQWAQRAEKMSAGLITPTIHDALRASGYEHSFDARRAFKRSGAASPLPITVAHAWTLHPTRRAVTLAPHTHLDLNGVAKGWAAEQTANYLGELGPALVDTGGDMVMTAPRAVGAPWHIGIEDAFHPEHENKRLPLLAIARAPPPPRGAMFANGRATARRCTISLTRARACPPSPMSCAPPSLRRRSCKPKSPPKSYSYSAARAVWNGWPRARGTPRY